MHRKIVFQGSLLTKDLSDADKVSLAEAFATLHRLSDLGVIEFRRNAGKTVTPGRKPDNVLTPQALVILGHADGMPSIRVDEVTAALGLNRNSVTAHLYRLHEAGYLTRRQVDRSGSGTQAGHRNVWAYAITEAGRAALPSDRPDAGDAEDADGPRPG